MTFKDFANRSKQLGYKLSFGYRKALLTNVYCTIVVNKHYQEVAFIQESKSGIYAIVGLPYRNTELDLITDYAATPIKDRQRKIFIK